MNHQDRILACINGIPVDRPPLVLWRHFPVADQDPVEHSKATLDFQNRFDFDLIKVSPSSSYCLVEC
jgi:uroporphyrinogen decarboxylase